MISFENIVSIVLCMTVGMILLYVLQAYLSKKENKKYGKILPIIHSIVAVIFTIVSIIMLNSNIDGAKVQESNIGLELVNTLVFLVLYNIPTVIYTVIYKSCRKKINSVEKN